MPNKRGENEITQALTLQQEESNQVRRDYTQRVSQICHFVIKERRHLANDCTVKIPCGCIALILFIYLS